MSYADTNYSNDTKTRQSIISYIYYLNRVAISWSKKKVKILIVSLTKAEYVTFNNASKKAI